MHINTYSYRPQIAVKAKFKNITCRPITSCERLSCRGSVTRPISLVTRTTLY